MEKVLPIISDLSIIFFDLLIFSKMIVLKNKKTVNKLMIYVGCAVIITAYFFATYIYNLPASVSSVLCMSVPSLLLFYCFSEYKDARFFLTFCFVDTTSLIIAFFGRYAGILSGRSGSVVSLCVVVLLFSVLYFTGRPYFQRYTELLETVNEGWGAMMASTCIIYFGLVFIAAYPKPLVKRIEYAPSYLTFCAVVLSSYAVFIKSIVKTKKINEQFQLLQKEKKFHKLAYIDALTEIGNRAAYMDKINMLERTRGGNKVCVLVFDMNDFKNINDTLGHQMGDMALKAAADVLRQVFPEPSYSVFRIGGDEFSAFAQNQTEAEIGARLGQVNQLMKEKSAAVGIPLSLSVGYEFVGANDTLEKCFYRADQKMYQAKKEQKLGEEKRGACL